MKSTAYVADRRIATVKTRAPRHPLAGKPLQSSA